MTSDDVNVSDVSTTTTSTPYLGLTDSELVPLIDVGNTGWILVDRSCINNPRKMGWLQLVAIKLNEMKLQKKSGVIKMIKLDTNLKGSLFGMFPFYIIVPCLGLVSYIMTLVTLPCLGTLVG